MAGHEDDQHRQLPDDSLPEIKGESNPLAALYAGSVLPEHAVVKMSYQGQSSYCVGTLISTLTPEKTDQWRLLNEERRPTYPPLNLPGILAALSTDSDGRKIAVMAIVQAGDQKVKIVSDPKGTPGTYEVLHLINDRRHHGVGLMPGTTRLAPEEAVIEMGPGNEWNLAVLEPSIGGQFTPAVLTVQNIESVLFVRSIPALRVRNARYYGTNPRNIDNTLFQDPRFIREG